MFESFILGAVQGVAEWLPVSSEAMVILVKTNFFTESPLLLSELISYAIFLHLGTLLAVLVWYWKKIGMLLSDALHYSSLHTEKKQYLNFIVIATGVSGGVGYFLLQLVEKYEYFFSNSFVVNIIVGIFLGITALLLFVGEKGYSRTNTTLTKWRAVLTGLFQGCAAIPGISRSGSTIAGMGLLAIDKKRALELSFILSIPLVFFANIVLNINTFQSFSWHHVISLASAFLFGIVTIAGLLKIVEKIRFSYFVGIFAILLILLTFVLS